MNHELIAIANEFLNQKSTLARLRSLWRWLAGKDQAASRREHTTHAPTAGHLHVRRLVCYFPLICRVASCMVNILYMPVWVKAGISQIKLIFLNMFPLGWFGL